MKTWADAQKVAPGDSDVQAFTDPGGVIATLAYSILNGAASSPLIRNNGSDTGLLDLAAMYWMLHAFTLGNKRGGSGGPTETEKVGDVTRTMAVLQEDPAYDSTPYGRMYLAIVWRAAGIESRILVSGGANVLPPIPFGPRFIP